MDGARGFVPRPETSLDVVAEGENVAIGIFEPCYLISGGCGPDSQFLVGDEGVFLGHNTSFDEPQHGGSDVFHFPSQNGPLCRAESVRFSDADHVRARAQGEREIIEADELKAQLVDIEITGPLIVSGIQESNDFGRIQHATSGLLL